MIEFRDPKKRLWLKAIAWFLVVTFVWYDIAWAGDLFYRYGGRPAQAALDTNKKEVTNYDVLDYSRKQSIAEKLLPSNRDREATGSFAPGYVQEGQAKHEDIIKIKQGAEDLGWMLDKAPKRQDAEIDLKKKHMISKKYMTRSPASPSTTG